MKAAKKLVNPDKRDSGCRCFLTSDLTQTLCSILVKAFIAYVFNKCSIFNVGVCYNYTTCVISLRLIGDTSEHNQLGALCTPAISRTNNRKTDRALIRMSSAR